MPDIRLASKFHWPWSKPEKTEQRKIDRKETVMQILNGELVSKRRQAYWKIIPFAKTADYAEAKLIVQIATFILKHGEAEVPESCRMYIPEAQRYADQLEKRGKGEGELA